MRAAPVVLTLALCACGRSGFSNVDARMDGAGDGGLDGDANDFDDPGVVELTLQGDHVCVRTGTGIVRCWGSNASGQVGNGLLTPTEPLTVVSGLPAIAKVVASESSTYAIDRDGELWAWGYNGDGQLGIGSGTDEQTVPIKVSLPEKVRDVAAGEINACVVGISGALYCTGENSCGQLGQASADVTSFILVPGVTGLRSLAVDDIVICGIGDDDALICWGDETRPCGTISAPGPVASVATARAVSGGCHETRCVAGGDGRAYCWGVDSAGSLGDGSTSDSNSATPVMVATITGVTKIGTGYSTACAGTDDNELWCWGENANGALGVAMTVPRAFAPIRVGMDDFADGTRPIDQIALGCGTSCVRTGHDVYCWGSDDEDEILGTTDNPAFLPRRMQVE